MINLENRKNTDICNRGKDGGRDGSGVKSVYCSSRGPQFGSQHPHWATHNFLEVQLQGNPMPSSDLFGYLHTHTVETHTDTLIQQK